MLLESRAYPRRSVQLPLCLAAETARTVFYLNPGQARTLLQLKLLPEHIKIFSGYTRELSQKSVVISGDSPQRLFILTSEGNSSYIRL